MIELDKLGEDTPYICWRFRNGGELKLFWKRNPDDSIDFTFRPSDGAWWKTLVEPVA